MAINGRLLFMLVVIVWFFVLTWLAINPNGPRTIAHNRPLLFVLASAALVPIYPLYLLAKRWRRFAKGIAVLAGGLVLTTVFVVAHYLLYRDDVWIRGVFDLSQALCVLASLMLVWQAAKS